MEKEIKGKKKETGIKIIIDAKGAILGRLSSFVSKKALQGNKIIVVNAQEAIIIGKQKVILEKYLKRTRLGHGAQKGPLFPRTALGIVKRSIRGMTRRKR